MNSKPVEVSIKTKLKLGLGLQCCNMDLIFMATQISGKQLHVVCTNFNICEIEKHFEKSSSHCFLIDENKWLKDL